MQVNTLTPFLQHVKYLEYLQESYTASKTISIFLYQVSDPDYKHTIETCIESRFELNECIERLRSKERRLIRDRDMKRKGTISIRRNEQKRIYDETQENITSEVKLED